MDEAIHGTMTDETKRFWRIWSIVKNALDKGKLVDNDTMQQLLGATKETARTWLNRIEHAGFIRKAEIPRKGTRAQIIYVSTGLKFVEGESYMEMSKLYDINDAWLRVHKIIRDNQDNQGKNGKNIFYTKKIKIPDYTLSILSNIIKGLPDAPEVADEEPEYTMDKSGQMGGLFG